MFLLGCFHFGEEADTFFGVSILIHEKEKRRVILLRGIIDENTVGKEEISNCFFKLSLFIRKQNGTKL